MAENIARSPYVGPRPFNREDQAVFFGRSVEIDKLAALVSAYATVLLFSQSGAGKTSLINAGLLPLLEKRRDIQILAPARVGVKSVNIDTTAVDNIYTFNVISKWDGEATPVERLARMTLPEYLRSMPRPLDEFEVPVNRLVIIDQFEELFTTFPDRWEDRAVFFDQLRRALNEDRQLSILFAMREDYIAELVPYEASMPGRLGTRLRLERLRRDAALMAVAKPLEATNVSFADGVAEKLVDDLMSVQVETGVGEVKSVIGEFVEPVVLQVVCDNLWQSLPKGTQVIEQHHADQFAQVTGALMRYYDACIEDTTRKTASPDLDADTLRRWFGETLITPVGTRGTVYQGVEQTGDLANADVSLLEKWHIIRGEQRANARWYELSHDRFIQPILRSNEAWRLEQERLRAEAEKTRAAKVERRYTGAPINTRVFLSYARQDMDIARRLLADLDAAGIDTWVDFQDIAPSAEWYREIQRGIDSTDAFVLLLSRNALSSVINNDEIRYARERGKRMIPLLVSDLGDFSSIFADFMDRSSRPDQVVRVAPETMRDNWEALQRLNFILMRPTDNYDDGLNALMTVLATDETYLRLHTQLLLRAQEWESGGRSTSFLLVGDALAEAEAWLNKGLQPEPTPLHRDYIRQSREHEDNRQRVLALQRRVLQRTLIGGAIAVILGIISIAGFLMAAQQSSLASNNAATSDANALLAQAQAQTATNAQGDALAQALTATNAQGLAISAQSVAEENAAAATIAQGEALISAGTALAAQATAARAAERVSELARSIALAGGAEVTLNENAPDVALALALEANAIQNPPLQARAALVRAIQNSNIIRRYAGHADQVVSVANSAAFVAGGGRDGRLIIWDIETGRVVHDINTRLTDLTGLDFSPDGSRLLAGGCAERTDIGCARGSVQLWDAVSGERLWDTREFDGFIGDALFSPDGQWAAAFTEGSGALVVLNAETGAEARRTRRQETSLYSLAFSPDSSRLFAGAQGTLEIYGVTDLALDERVTGLNNTPISLDVLPDDSRLFYGTQDGFVTLWELNQRAPTNAVSVSPSAVNSVTISPDGRNFISGAANGTLLRWNTDLAVLNLFNGHNGAIWDVSYSADGQSAFSASADGNVIRWDAARLSSTLYTANAVITQVEVSPDGAWVAALLQNRDVILLSLRGDGERFTISLVNPVTRIEFVNGAQELRLIADGVEYALDLQTLTLSEPVATTEEANEPSPRLSDAIINVTTVSRDGRLLLRAGSDGFVRIFDAQSETLFRTINVGAVVLTADFSPDGRLLLTGDDAQNLLLWDVETGELLRRYAGSTDWVRSAVFTPDGRGIISASDVTLTLWRVEEYGDDLAAWARTFRYVPPLTCADIGRFLPNCAVEIAQLPTRTYPTLPPTATFTATLTPSITPTFTPSATFTNTPSLTPSATPTWTRTLTHTPTATFTREATPIFIETRLMTWTNTSSPTRAQPTPTGTITKTFTPTPNLTATSVVQQTAIAVQINATIAALVNATLTAAVTPTFTPSLTFTPTPTLTPTATFTPTLDPAVLPALDALAALGIDVNSGSVSATNASTVIDLTGRDNITQLQNVGGDYVDFAFGTTINWGAGALDDQCGVGLRRSSSQDSMNNSRLSSSEYYAVTISREGQLTFALQSPVRVMDDMSGSGAFVRTGRGDANTLWIVARDDTFTVYVNGSLAAQFSDARLIGGAVALLARTFASSNQAGCTFSDTWVFAFDEGRAPVIASPTLTPSPTPTLTRTPTRTPTASLTPTGTPVPLNASACQVVVQGLTGLNMRAAPDGQVITRLDPYARANVLEVVQPQASIYRWVRATDGQFEGWMREDFLGFIGDCAAFGEQPRYPAPIESGWFVRGYEGGGDAVTSYFGWLFGAAVGEPVYSATAGGEVVETYRCDNCTESNPSSVSQGYALGDHAVLSDPAWGYGYGNAVIVRYPFDQLPAVTQTGLSENDRSGASLVCLYGHLNSLEVEAGAAFDNRRRIGEVGQTGSIEAAALTLQCAIMDADEAYPGWEALRQNRRIDPINAFERLIAPSLVAHIVGTANQTALMTVNVRSQPSASSDLLFLANIGVRELPVLDVQPDSSGATLNGNLPQWFLLRFSSGQGWVRDDLISIEGDGSPFGYPAALPETRASDLIRAAESGRTPFSLDTAAQLSLVRELQGHTEDPWSLAFSPDGSLLLTGSEDNQAIVWDTETGDQRVVVRDTSDVTAIAFNHQGTQAVIGDFGGLLTLVDLATNAQTVLRDYDFPIRTLAYSPDDSLLAVGGSDGIVYIWWWDGTGVMRPTAMWSGHTDGLNNVAFSPDGTRLLSASDDATIRLLSVSNGELIAVLEGHTRGDTLYATFSPDGSKIASYSWDRQLNIWDGNTGALIGSTRTTYGINALAFSPDGLFVAVGTLNSDLAIYWADQSPSLYRALAGHSGDISQVTFTPDGAMVISASYDDSVRVWAVATGEQIARLSGHRTDVIDMTISADQTLLVSGDVSGRVLLYSLDAAPSECVVTATAALNVRSGAAPTFDVVGTLRTGETRVAIGRGESPNGGQWWQIGENEWVFADFTTTEGSCDILPRTSP